MIFIIIQKQQQKSIIRLKEVEKKIKKQSKFTL
jgi:hypothetical protein